MEEIMPNPGKEKDGDESGNKMLIIIHYPLKRRFMRKVTPNP